MGSTAQESKGAGEATRHDPVAAARRRAAAELAARHSAALRRMARGVSLCEEDAEDAYQRALEILLTKAPRGTDLLSWARTVVKHEAIALRHYRERMLGQEGPDAPEPVEEGDWVELIPSEGDGPQERFERGERIARAREALGALRPDELRVLSLLAEGYSYAEIAATTGFGPAKVNHCAARGRERFRRQLLRSEDGSRCAELAPLLSVFCDGMARPSQAAEVRDHLRACAHCRAALRAYRAAPAAAAALAPALPLSRTLLERAQELLLGLQSRLPGGGGAEAGAAQTAAAGGARGAGMTALAKLLAVCAGTAGGAAACVAAGVTPPLDLLPEGGRPPALERPAQPPPETSPPPSRPPAEETRPAAEAPAEREQPAVEQPAPARPAAPPTSSGAVEYAPPTPAPQPPPAPTAPRGSPAGEFGP